VERYVMAGPMFAPDDPVEIVRGDAKGQRGRVEGFAPTSMIPGVRDLAVKPETGRTIWIRPDFVRELVAPEPSPSDDDVLSPLRRTACPE
jgi:hypothetical protein